MLAIIEAYRAGLLKRRYWPSNIMAGIIVGIVALPLAMAFAIASGAKPEQGLYTAIISGICVGLFGGSRIQIAGPTGAFIVILANITAHFGISGLQMASLLAGIILLFMGAIQLGNVIKYIPAPVIVGFTTGIGLIIFIGEWKDFFGLPVNLPLDANFYQKSTSLIQALPHLNLAATSMACLSLLLILITPKFSKRIPGPLVAMLTATLLQSVFHFSSIATLGSAFGGIPQHLPHFQLPAFSFDQMVHLIGPAFTIALLGAIESLLSATAADGMAGTKHHANQELIGQGIANIFSPLFGGFAATGAIARTATNVRNGGNSPIAAVIHSLLLLSVIILLAPLAMNIPLCTLAAILFVVAYNMSDIPHFIHMLKHAPRYDIIILLTTFLLTVLTNLVVAVNVGVILAMLFFVKRMNESVEAVKHDLPSLPDDVLVYSIQGPLFFGTAEKVERVLSAINNSPKTIVFRLKDIPFMDMTGLETFKELLQRYNHHKISVYLCEANARIIYKLTRTGLLKWVSHERVFNTFDEVIQTALIPAK